MNYESDNEWDDNVIPTYKDQLLPTGIPIQKSEQDILRESEEEYYKHQLNCFTNEEDISKLIRESEEEYYMHQISQFDIQDTQLTEEEYYMHQISECYEDAQLTEEEIIQISELEYEHHQELMKQKYIIYLQSLYRGKLARKEYANKKAKHNFLKRFE